MLKARIRWCSCRVENILTFGKLLRLVLFPSPFYFVFDISNLLSYIQNNFSYELARPIMGTIFLVIISMNKSQELTIFHGRQKLTSVKN